MIDSSQAACRPYHSDFWFPPVFSEERTGKESEYHEVAKHVCERCPIVDGCALMGADEAYGVWGGWTPRERRKGSMKWNTKTLPQSKWGVIPPPNSGTPVEVTSVRTDVKANTVVRKK